MKKFVKSALLVIRKDIMIEWKSKEIISSMLVFSSLVIFVFSFMIEGINSDLHIICAGLYWIAVVFSLLLGLNRSMQTEMENGNLFGILQSPAPRGAFFIGKVVSNLLFCLLIATLMVPLVAVFFNINLIGRGEGLFIIILGCYGLSLLGTLFSIIAAKSRSREILLPLLLLPTAIPLIISVTNLIYFISLGEIDYSNWFKLLIVYDILFSAVSIMVFEPVVEL